MKNFWKAANFKGHLLTAISYMIPIVCGAGFVIAIGMAFGGTSQDSLVMGKFNFLEALPRWQGPGHAAGHHRHRHRLLHRR